MASIPIEAPTNVPFRGEKGIRTPETFLTFTRFPGGPVQPLLHLSKSFDATNIELFYELSNNAPHRFHYGLKWLFFALTSPFL